MGRKWVLVSDDSASCKMLTCSLHSSRPAQRFYGMAAKLINIARARIDYKQNYLIIRGDPDRLFFEEQHNEAYHRHLQERRGVLAAQKAQRRSGSTPLRQWGKPAERSA